MSAGLNADLRKKRREGILLTIGSAIFVALGVLGHYAFGDRMVTLVGIPLFGSCMLIGIFQTLKPGRGLPNGLVILCSLVMGAAGVMNTVFHMQGLEVARWYWRHWEMPVGIAMTVFFGGGGILLLVREVRRRLTRKRE